MSDVAVLAGTGKSGRRVAAALRVGGHRVRVAGRRGPARFDRDEPATWTDVVRGGRRSASGEQGRELTTDNDGATS